MPEAGEVWKVTGGADKGGILVREGLELTSRVCGRLSCGALVRELEVREERLRFRRLVGEGPDQGWVTKKLGEGRELLVKAPEAPGSGEKLQLEPHNVPQAAEHLAGVDSVGKAAAAKERSSDEKGPTPHRALPADGGSNKAAKQLATVPSLGKPRVTGDNDSEEEGPTSYRVKASGGTAVFVPSGSRRGTGEELPDGAIGREAGRLRFGDVVAVKERSGNWFRLADWEALAGWVPPRGDGSEALEPVPYIPVTLLRLRNVVARTERHLIRAQAAGRPWEPLPRDPAYLGKAPSHSIHSSVWGIEARCVASSAALAPPGRDWRVFAARPFAEGDEIERCEVLSTPAGLLAMCPRSVALRGHVLGVPGGGEEVLPLGFGALYRQADVPERANATMAPTEAGRKTPRQLVLRAARRVAIGEELTVCLSTDHLGRRFLPETCGARQESVRTAAHALPLGERSGTGSVYAGQSTVHGLGVFAARSFERDEIVELCPLLLLDSYALGANAFRDYRMSFDVGLPSCKTTAARHAALRNFGKDIDPSALWWPPEGDERPPRISGLALGAGPLYNHAARMEDHNLWWKLHPGLGVVVMQAKKYIRQDTEIFIDYGGTYWQGRHLRPK